MASVSLRDALENIHAGTVKARGDGIRDLKHILDYNRHSASIHELRDADFHNICETLFACAVHEQPNALRGKTATARTSACNKLSDIANALRHTVEAGLRALKPRTARAVLDHVRDTIFYDDDARDFCLPLALDYARTMRTVFEHPPHVAQLHQGRQDQERLWQRCADFCVDAIAKIAREQPPDADSRSTPGAVGGSGLRSSASATRDAAGSQAGRHALRPVAEEMVLCLRLLTAVPTAPLHAHAEPILCTILDSLQRSAVSHKAWSSAFAAINNVLAWSRTEAVATTQKVVGHVIKAIRQLWRSNGTKEAAGHMLVTLLLLDPYVSREMRQPTGLTLRPELTGLLHTLQMDYTRRKEREQLRLDDVRLEINPRHLPDGKVATALLTLRCAGLQTESNWLMLHVMAFLHRVLLPRARRNASDGKDDEHEPDREINPRPPKRPRTQDDFGQLIAAITTGTQQERLCAIQTVAFLAPQTVLGPSQLNQILDSTGASCSDKDGTICSWSFLASASCAVQGHATHASLAGRLTAIWQLALRSLSNAASSRAACFSLYVLLKLRLIPQHNVTELLQITHTMDLNGPSHLSDGACVLLSALVHLSQESSPAAGERAATAVATWATQTFTPSRLEDKHYATNCRSYDASDVLRVLSACLGRDAHQPRPTGFPTWDVCGCGWLLCVSDKMVVSYLLLSEGEGAVLNEALFQADDPPPGATKLPTRSVVEMVLLGHMNMELSRTSDAFGSLVCSKQVTVDMFTTLCKACISFTCASECVAFRDTRAQEQMQQQLRSLLTSVQDFVASLAADQDKVDVFLSIFTGPFANIRSTLDPPEPFSTSACEMLACATIKHATSRRQNARLNSADDDLMDLDETGASHDSRPGPAPATPYGPCNDLDAAFSPATLRTSSVLYATTMLAVQEDRATSHGRNTASGTVVDFIVHLSPDAVLSCRDVMASLPSLGLALTASDALRLLNFLHLDLINRPAYIASEVAIGLLLDVMLSIIGIWTDPHNKKAHDFGLDAYAWFNDVALPAGLFSPNVVRRFMNLLLHLFQTDEEYGADDGSPVPRTVLFDFPRTAPISAQYHLAGRLPHIFGLYVLSRHENVFDDLLPNLCTDGDWFEGTAMRSLYLSKLGAAWPSLLRRCVHGLFEGAGSIEGAAAHSTICIRELASALPLQEPRTLFRLFAPQLLWAWSDGTNPDQEHRLDALPFGAFQYQSLRELVHANEAEILAQTTLRGNEQDLELATRAIGLLPRDAVKRSYAQCLAYCMAYDVSHPKRPGCKSNPAEERLREAAGGKAEHQKLIVDRFPAIVGHFYLIMATQDGGDHWLAHRDGYTEAAKALEQIKAYSHSTRALPRAPAPSVKDHYLPDELGRLQKRTQLALGALWGPSSFALTARMLISAINESLGSLHTCLMIRRLRLLVAIGGELALDGFGIEMLIHSLRPWVNDSECADDALGILHYLFNHGRPYLRSSVPFATGAIVLLILQMQAHARRAHDRTTQDRQHAATVQRMIDFHRWLVDCLAALTADHDLPAFTPLHVSLRGLQLPGNGRAGSPEADLLLFLLDQWRSAEPMCSRQDITEALALLSHEFVLPHALSDDCLGADQSAARYAQALWEVVGTAALGDRFATWAATVIGRAYAATGVRPRDSTRRDAFVLNGRPEAAAAAAAAAVSHTAASRATILQHVCSALYSRRRSEAALADYTLRRIQERLASAGPCDESAEFSQLLPDAICAAVGEGTFGWAPHASAAAAGPEPAVTDAGSMRDALGACGGASIDAWATRLASALSAWPAANAIVSSLAPLVQHVDGLALQMLPSMIHLCLEAEAGADADAAPALRPLLSDAVRACTADAGDQEQAKQRFFLQLLAYLRSQPLPGEATTADRLKWLDVDWVLAAGAASRCHMPTCALLLAESAAPAVAAPSGRRSTGRASAPPHLHAGPIPDELQMAIYRQIDEPDSFYGVPQPATIGSVLTRLDHEQDGFRSLMFRSAQMDSHMRHLHRLPEHDAVGMVQSLSALNFNSLAFALVTQGMGDRALCSAPLLHAAQSLQQWDIAVPAAAGESSIPFAVFQELSRAGDLQLLRDKSQHAILRHVTSGLPQAATSAAPSRAWCAALATLTEVDEVIACRNEAEVLARWDVMRGRQGWMRMARFEEVQPLMSSRHTLFGVLGQNRALQDGLHLSPKQLRALEVKALLASSGLAREHSQLQEALTATATLSDLAERCGAVDLDVRGAAKLDTATVLSAAREVTISVKMLRDVLEMPDLEQQDVPVGRAGLLAQLGHQLAEARLETPEDILEQYLKPAVAALQRRAGDGGQDAGKVYHALATFCDKELQNPGTVENLRRVTKLREDKEKEVEAYDQALRAARKSGSADRDRLGRNWKSAKQWLAIDRMEEQRLAHNRTELVKTSLQNYLRALEASTDHDLSVLRFFAMWLENAGERAADEIVDRYLPRVASWKFVRLMNQLMTKLEDGTSRFQRALGALMARIFKEHPFHSLHHLFAASQKPHGSPVDEAARARYKIAGMLQRDLAAPAHASQKFVVDNIFRANARYQKLAEAAVPDHAQQGAKMATGKLPEAHEVVESATVRHLPPITLSIPLQASGRYDDVPRVARFDHTLTIMGGLSAPKMLRLWDTAGGEHRQLFKSGKDDLRQDAIMEQVFEEVSNMLRSHKATRQRDLKVRTYKVINLAKTSGVIEFVPHSIPFNDYLKPAHQKYHPADWSDGKARREIVAAYNNGQGSPGDRVRAYQRVCAHMHPVLRHFFFERFTQPDEWFHKRTAYTRTTASVSMVGHMMGLGDRHCSNILLDETTGEVVHIDLGVAFEAGRVLQIPELIPFRLTRDVVDGMGVTQTEGVFRRCCEFTLDAVRHDRESIMTLLNVLRYDPLVEWSVSPLRAKRMQDESNARLLGGGGGGHGPDHAAGKHPPEHSSAGEADRALATVEKKLAQTMSTTATVNELIRQATDEKNLALLFHGWAAFF